MDAEAAVTYKGAIARRPEHKARTPTMPARLKADVSRIERQCAEQGLRLTGQRRTIARVLTAAEDHPSVEEVYGRANAIDPGISLSTVYRTLKLFSSRGILERHAFGTGRGRYEQAHREHHDHLIDIETGKVMEFTNEDIEKIQERVARQLGFTLVGHRLELYGVPIKKRSK
jgi:Fur family transcriptional regulator, ferric uptake regulator